jgi:hypothetical protein
MSGPRFSFHNGELFGLMNITFKRHYARLGMFLITHT